MRILSIALRIAFAFYVGLSVSAIGARPAAAVSWSNPHHAYVIFDRVKGKEHQPYIRIVGLAKNAPSHVLSGARTGLATGIPAALAVGPQGNLYVSGLFSGPSFVPEILIYGPGAFGNVAPIATIAGTATRLNNPRGIAFDRAGNLYVADSSDEGGRQAAIDVYAAGATGNVAPIARIAGSQTHLMSGNLIAIAVDDGGEVFAGQDIFAGQVVKFAAGASGNVAPLAIANVSRANPLTELATSGTTVYVPVRAGHPVPKAVVYKLSTADLSPQGVVRDASRFQNLWADADSQGRLYVQDLVPLYQMLICEFAPGGRQPERVQPDGTQFGGGGYIVVGP